MTSKPITRQEIKRLIRQKQGASGSTGTTSSGGNFSGDVSIGGELTVGELNGVLKALDGLVSGGATTTDVPEGGNLYYTQSRFNTAFAAKSTTDLSEGTNLYYTTTRFDTAFATKDTDDLGEGSTNLYYTSTRFDTDFATKDTDDLSEGSTNLYYTSTRFDTDLATKDTDDLGEGTANLYNKVPTGGTTGQSLTKVSNTDYDLTWTTVSGGGISDADYGDITVSSSGTVWTIDADTVTYDKMQDTSGTDVVLGRSTAGGGTIEEIACTAAGRAILDDADATTQRTTLGLGSIATQAASAVSITGGSISGIVDLAIADGGTGASTTDGALINLGIFIDIGTIADDTAASFSLSSLSAIILCIPNATTSGPALVLHCRASSQPSITAMSAIGASYNLGTTALTGTTGPDGATNFAATSAGVFYVENRRGYAVVYSLYVFRL